MKSLKALFIFIHLIFLHSYVAAQDFIVEWTFPSAVTQVRFSALTEGGNVDYTWTAMPSGNNGNGSFKSGGAVTLSGLNVPAGNTLTVSFASANLRRFYNGTDHNRITDVKQWGTVPWSSMTMAFFQATNLVNFSAADTPILSGVTSMHQMFYYASSFNGDIGNWNTTNVTNMQEMFSNATSFNGNVGSWNTANVTNMQNMFWDATSFNGNIENWNTANVANMSSMFSGATSFNGNIGNWNTANVTNMYNMFGNATSFNRDIGNWNTAKVTKMKYMLYKATSFNQDIGNWNTAHVTDMEQMFYSASSFNQDIGSWNTANVTNMSGMFYGAKSFNQPSGDWTFNPKVILAELFSSTGMDCNNYSSTLIGWQRNNPDVRDRELGCTGLRFGTNAVAARNALINQGWNIYGDTPSGTLCDNTATEDTYQSKTAIYPNPGYDIIYIDGLEGSNGYTLHNLTGQIIKTGIIDADHLEIAISHLNAGIYILKIDTNQGAVYHRVAKAE